MKRKWTRADCTSLAMVAGNEKYLSQIIMNGKVHEWTGIGWIELDPPTDEERKRLPVIE